MTARSMTKADLFTSIFLLVFAAAVTTISLRMPTMTERGASIFSGPGVVPAIIGAILFLLGVALLVRSLKRGALDMSAPGSVTPPAVENRAPWARIARTLTLCLIYVILMGRVWFPLLSFLFVLSFILVFEYDFKTPFRVQWKVPLAAAALAAAA
ncbi:MAG TPA: tripartite tricarboxylate transporter TctB family protein, partial [Magnetospirillaceae bacterium]|nr:tripartite tricarboxylate transporter TctB family protein [Magnetospirillaceae bacterium]